MSLEETMQANTEALLANTTAIEAQTAALAKTPTPAAVKPKPKRKTAAQKKAEGDAIAAAEKAALAEAGEANPFDDDTPEDAAPVSGATHDDIRRKAGEVMKLGVQRPQLVKAIQDAGATKIEGLAGGQIDACLKALMVLGEAAEANAEL